MQTSHRLSPFYAILSTCVLGAFGVTDPDLQLVSSGDIDNDFEGFLMGGASTNTMAVAIQPDGHFGRDPGGHLSAGIDDVVLGNALDPWDAPLSYPGGSVTYSTHGAKPVIPAGGHATPS